MINKSPEVVWSQEVKFYQEFVDEIFRFFFLVTARTEGGLGFIIEPRDIVVEVGGSARLDCQATSTLGHPTIQWRSDDGQPINFIGDSYR